jgi:CheY-like chemotaxis protein
MGSRILIVDDVESNRKLVSVILSGHGYEVSAAANGVDAIAKARQESPDLIMLDVMMPQLDGWEVRELLRAEATTREIPIVFLSALEEEDISEKNLDPRLDSFLIKPFKPSEVIASIERVLGSA